MRTKANFIRNATLTSLFALCASSTAFAQTATPSTGLGQAWPNATDVSASPNWHVYVFVLNGVKYIQVNDLNGTVHAAVATANGTLMALPVGVDAQNVTTTTAAQSVSSTNSATQTVYNDGTTAITATPQSSGATQIKVKTNACPTLDCSGGSIMSGGSL
ncbi:hypothetical protein [Dyella sp. M7H15-1]|uniref:hypothetical protein n=1 Tax=Dyella sp. M7H15-1 TaxID=2501295 RepID=UPI00197AA4D3|nr:hypothetical protein [Dyella sp. M7H15-1]